MKFGPKGAQMLPFLKNKQEGSVSGPIESQERKHDDGFDMLGAVADDLLAAIEKKDKGALKAALEALCEHIQDLDSEQDQLMEGE